MKKIVCCMIVTVVAIACGLGVSYAADTAKPAAVEAASCSTATDANAVAKYQKKVKAFENALESLLAGPQKNQRTPNCPAESSCVQPDCYRAADTCQTWSTASNSCSQAGGGTFSCPAGQNVHVEKCNCKNGAQFCLEFDVRLFCQ